MYYVTYNILSIFLLIPVICYHLYRSVKRGRRAAFSERFGRISPQELVVLKNRRVIWLHAVSVGEAIAARPLLKALRRQYPDHAIVVSNTTETGREVSSGFPEPDLCIYFPFDFLPAVRNALDAINPGIIIIMETEIWPNFNHEAASRQIPIVLVNGRISDRSYERYLRYRWLFRNPLSHFSLLCMQTETDSERIIAIGAIPEKTRVTGNLKFDIPLRQEHVDERSAMRTRYGINNSHTVITAGSTHPGEEGFVLDAYQKILSTNEALLLVLVPRHPERADEVANLLERYRLTYKRRSTLKISDGNLFNAGEVLLVDTLGELMDLYALSDLVFVGGSLVATGGHNLLEPASVGVPSVFGPYTSNFREITYLVQQYEAGVQVDTPDRLAETWARLIDDAQERKRLGQNGLKMLQDNGGATERHMQVVSKYI